MLPSIYIRDFTGSPGLNPTSCWRLLGYHRAFTHPLTVNPDLQDHSRNGDRRGSSFASPIFSLVNIMVENDDPDEGDDDDCCHAGGNDDDDADDDDDSWCFDVLFYYYLVDSD